MNISKRNTLLIIALVLLIAGTYVFLASRSPIMQPSPLEESETTSTTTEIQDTPGIVSGNTPHSVPQASGTAVTFVNADDVSLSIVFSEESLVLNGLGYVNTKLPQVISASGARYENSDGLEVWNKGDEITVSKNGRVIFQGAVVNAKGLSPQLAGTQWKLESVINEEGKRVVPQRVEIFTLAFGTDGKLSGTTDCNNFSGGYTFEDGMLTLGTVAQTLMYCEGSQEQEFITALKTGSLAVSFKNTDTLVLKIPNEPISLTLMRDEE